MANDLGRRLYSSIQWLVPYALQTPCFHFCATGQSERQAKLEKYLACRLRCLCLCRERSVFPRCHAHFHLDLSWRQDGIELASCFRDIDGLLHAGAASRRRRMRTDAGIFCRAENGPVTVIGLIASTSAWLSAMSLSCIFGWAVAFGGGGCGVCCLKVFEVDCSYALSFEIDSNVPEESALFLATATAVAVYRRSHLGSSELMNHLLSDGIAAALAAIRGGETVIPEVSRCKIICRLAVALSAGGVAFLAGAFVLRLAEARQMLEWAWEKVRNKIF